MTETTDPATAPSTPAWKRVLTIVIPLLILALALHGLAKEFDSMAATMRLAVKTGALTDPDGFAANFGVSRHSIDAAIMDAGDESERNWGANTVMRAPPWST